MSVDVADLVARIRLKSGLKNNVYFKDDQLAEFASDGASELFDLLVKANEHYFVRKFSFTLAGGVGGNTVQRPADFYKEQLMELDPTNPYPTTVPMLGDLGSKNRAGAFGILTNGAPARQWFLDGDTIEVIPAPAAAGNYQLRYTPILERLVLPSTVDLSINYPSIPVNVTARLMKATGGPILHFPGDAWPPFTTFTVFPDTFVASVLSTVAGGLKIDGQTPQVGDIIVIDPSAAPPIPATAVNMGIYVFDGVSDSGSLLNYQFTRLAGYTNGTTIPAGLRIAITDGNVYAGTILQTVSLWTPHTNSTTFTLAPDAPIKVQCITTTPLTGAWSALNANLLLLTQAPDSADQLKIDGEDLKIGGLYWFTFDDAPIDGTKMGFWRYDGPEDSSPNLVYIFSRPAGFESGDVVPMETHILVQDGATLRGTTQVVRRDVTLGTTNNVDVFPLNFMDSSGNFVLQNAELDPSFVGGVMTIEGSPNGPRSYRIASYVDESAGTLTGIDGAPLVNESFGAPTTIHVTHANERYTIPQEMEPWQDYIVIHASITVMQARQYPGAAALAVKLEEFKARIAGVAMNRTEDVAQAPITRHLRNRGPLGGNGGGW